MYIIKYLFNRIDKGKRKGTKNKTKKEIKEKINSKMEDVNLNTAIKSYRSVEWFKTKQNNNNKTWTNYVLFIRDTNKSKIKEWKKYIVQVISKRKLEWL